MIKVLFVCHGNICRSTMAEFVMKHLTAEAGLSRQFLIESAATSTEEIGNPVHPGTRKILAKKGIPAGQHFAVQMTNADYGKYDWIIGMDNWNIQNIKRITGGDPDGKICKLLDFTVRKGADIADPWYTGNFEDTYGDIDEGCRGFLKAVTSNLKS